MTSKGFTLIELMIVVAIIGILAALALPAYQDYSSRAKVAEPVSILRAMKSDIHSYVGEKGAFPTVAELQEYAGAKITSGQYTARVSDGATGEYIAFMRGTVGARINGKSVKLVFTTDSNGIVRHDCVPGDSDPIPNEYLPWECRNTP
ncbi:pilin [uncultured Pseudoteredinibacter sp.]|uniref:pilin n=1 Tax=uncultured Pseudoteredinibacter sp. TaxID=1641701 RepID=UPI00262A32C4|nr:pilin [uncultured Pseudoteredinibacter sp.]